MFAAFSFDEPQLFLKLIDNENILKAIKEKKLSTSRIFEILSLPKSLFPVFEHDNIDVTFKTKGYNCQPLPDDIRFRCNSRYAYMGVDYTREYSDLQEFTYTDPDTQEEVTTIGYSTCHLIVPHYVVTDHGSFRQYGTE